MRNAPQPKPRFTGLFIPAEILEMDLLPNEIFLLSWIDALDGDNNEKGGCFASNAYFSQKLHLKENTIVGMLTKLKRLGLIEQVSFDGRTRILKACKEKWFKKRRGQSQADCDYNHRQTRTTITPCPPLESHPHNIVYIKEDSKDSLTPIGGERSSSKLDSIPSEAKEVAQVLLNKILEMNPSHKLPNHHAWAKTLDLMMRVDKRPKQQV